MLNSSDSEILEAGIDEAGRGCLSGRVYVGCVILPNEDKFPDEKDLEIKDSKKLSRKKRTELAKYIKDNAIEYSVAWSDLEEIERKNILHATISAMHKALDKLSNIPENILVDGNYFNEYKYIDGTKINHVTIKQGDGKYLGIAAASILAKSSRDKYILDLCEKYPILKENYGLQNNMGYGTKVHLEGIESNGITQWHRKTFGKCRNCKKIKDIV